MSLTISGLSVAYAGADLLHDLDLNVDSGEKFAIMGPSGSGKSSLLRAIAGIIPSRGSIEIDGKDVTGLPTHERPIGLMFQDYALFPHMDVSGNVSYGLRMRGVPAAERVKRTSDLLERVGLAGFGGRDPMTLSGGEQQRVALARTLAPQPSLVMLDEPLGSLDLELRESLLEHTKSIVTDVGATTIYVTHDRGEAFAFADRVAILDQGSVAAIGTPSELWMNPKTVRVATLIGHTNVMDIGLHGFNTAVSIPTDAVRVDTDGDVKGVVEDSVFADGCFLVSVSIKDVEAPIKFVSPIGIRIGKAITLSVDRSQVIALRST
ncbi:MAG: ABC transporter ATP-binding protein [Actinomycetota bacterium]|nr:ABC transporter ATP-binding protein [Actinomycetota bacterium]